MTTRKKINKRSKAIRVLTAGICLAFVFGTTACNRTEQIQKQPEARSEVHTDNYDFSSEWLHIRERGKKTKNAPNLILIPGLVSSSEVWDGVIAELGKTHHLHIVDVSGFAGTPVSDEVGSGVINGIVNGLAEYIRTKKMENVTLMGHSMGGFASLMAARDHGDLIDRVIIVDSLPFYPVIFNPAATADAMAGQAKATGDMILALDNQAFEQMQKQAVVRMSKNETAQQQILSWSLNSDRATMAQAMKELMTSDLRPDLSKIEPDVYVIYAYDDAMGIPVDMGELFTTQYKDLKNGHLIRVENSFHFIMKDQPEEFLKVVQTALNTN